MRNLTLLIFVILNFNAVGQFNCLQVFVADVTLDPLNSEVVLVDFSNPNLQPVSLPGFRAYNTMTEEFLGSETVSYNSLPTESTHRVFIGNSIDLSQPVQLTFELWENEYDSLLCGFTWIGNLSNHPDCFLSELNSSTEVLSSPQDIVFIEISDYETNEVVVSETISLQAQNGLPFDSICLDEGCYNLEAEMVSPSLHSYSINLMLEPYIEYYLLNIPQGFTTYSGQFQIWDGCPVFIEDNTANSSQLFPTLSTDGFFEATSSIPIRTISIYTSEGRMIQQLRSNDDLKAISTNGMYIVVLELEDKTLETHRLVVQLN